MNPPDADLLHRLRRATTREGRPRRGEHLIVGLSGGCDSVALLDLLARLREELDLTLEAAHLDHGLREESADDLDFCRRLCEHLDVELHTRRVDVAARTGGDGIEAAGRRARYGFFDELREERGADRIATAHHLDDHVETLFLWLGRGTGLAGLRGIEASTDDRLRPLRSFRKRELVDYLRGRGLTWRHDRGNDEPRRRNRVRSELLPAFEEIFGPGALERLASFSRRAAADLRALDELTAHARRGCGEQATPGGCMLLREEFLRLPEVLQRQVLREVTAERATAGGHQRWNEDRLHDVLDRIHRGRPGDDVSLPGGGICGIDRRWLSFLEAPAPPETAPSGPWRLVEELLPPGQGMVTFLQRPGAAREGSTSLYEAAFDADMVRGPLTLRTLHPGDRIQPLGMKGHKKIRRLLAENSVPRHRRREQLVVDDRERVIWAVGLTTADPTRVRDDTRCILGLRVEPGPAGSTGPKGKDPHS